MEDRYELLFGDDWHHVEQFSTKMLGSRKVKFRINQGCHVPGDDLLMGEREAFDTLITHIYLRRDEGLPIQDACMEGFKDFQSYYRKTAADKRGSVSINVLLEDKRNENEFAQEPELTLSLDIEKARAKKGVSRDGLFRAVLAGALLGDDPTPMAPGVGGAYALNHSYLSSLASYIRTILLEEPEAIGLTEDQVDAVKAWFYNDGDSGAAARELGVTPQYIMWRLKMSVLKLCDYLRQHGVDVGPRNHQEARKLKFGRAHHNKQRRKDGRNTLVD